MLNSFWLEFLCLTPMQSGRGHQALCDFQDLKRLWLRWALQLVLLAERPGPALQTHLPGPAQRPAEREPGLASPQPATQMNLNWREAMATGDCEATTLAGTGTATLLLGHRRISRYNLLVCDFNLGLTGWAGWYPFDCTWFSFPSCCHNCTVLEPKYSNWCRHK